MNKYLDINISDLESIKSKENYLIVQELEISSDNYIKYIEKNLNLLNDLQFRIFLTNEIDTIYNTCKTLRNHSFSNTSIKDIYIHSLNRTLDLLELKYKPHIKEAFKSITGFWSLKENNNITESLFQNYISNSNSKVSINKSQRNVKKAKWEFVFELILQGIIIVENHRFFLNGIEYENKTQLGENISAFLSMEGEFRPIFTDSLSLRGSKDIFIPSNLKKIEIIMQKYDNKMCYYFQEKYDVLKSKNPNK